MKITAFIAILTWCNSTSAQAPKSANTSTTSFTSGMASGAAARPAAPPRGYEQMMRTGQPINQNPNQFQSAGKSNTYTNDGGKELNTPGGVKRPAIGPQAQSGQTQNSPKIISSGNLNTRGSANTNAKIRIATEEDTKTEEVVKKDYPDGSSEDDRKAYLSQFMKPEDRAKFEQQQQEEKKQATNIAPNAPRGVPIPAVPVPPASGASPSNNRR